MKKTFKFIGIGVIIFIIGALGGLMVDYVLFTKVITNPMWSENPIIKSLDNRIKIIKTVEKVIVADNESIADIASRAAGTVAYIESINVNGDVVGGNGIIVSSDGVIATTTAVVSQDENALLFVKLADGNVYDVKDVYFDTYSTVVFLRIDAQDLATVSFANSDDARSGKRLISISRTRSSDDAQFALGGFFGHDNVFGVATPESDFLQGVLSIDFSQSVLRKSIGAPVVDFHSNMIGLISVADSAEVINGEEEFFAIAANDVMRAFEVFLQQQNKTVEVTNKLGVDYDNITAIEVYAQDADITSGAVITTPITFVEQSAFARTLAARSGLRSGDIVVMVNNDTVDERNNLSRLMNKYANDEKVVLKVLRGDELILIDIISI